MATDSLKKKTTTGNRDQQDTKDKWVLRQNPNPRANENIPEEKKQKINSGAGSEVTDGEDG